MVNAFSFCLFGHPTSINNRVSNDGSSAEIEVVPGGYYDGLLENIQLIEKHYPDWRVYVYLGADVPLQFVEYLQTRYANVVTRLTGVLGYENTVRRFFTIDEPDVETMFVRDCDSRVHWRDRWAIDAFLTRTTRSVLIIRDHPEHSGMAAGTWGIRKRGLRQSMQSLFEQWEPIHYGSGDPSNVRGYGIDQNFLANKVYDLYANDIFVVHSFGKVYPNEIGINLPFHWSNYMYVGRVETKPVTENFWLRERDTFPPEEFPVVETRATTTPPPPPPKPQRREIWFQLHR